MQVVLQARVGRRVLRKCAGQSAACLVDHRGVVVDVDSDRAVGDVAVATPGLVADGENDVVLVETIENTVVALTRLSSAKSQPNKQQ